VVTASPKPDSLGLPGLFDRFAIKKAVVSEAGRNTADMNGAGTRYEYFGERG
jgi:hypothetical protein